MISGFMSPVVKVYKNQTEQIMFKKVRLAHKILAVICVFELIYCRLKKKKKNTT